MQTKYEGPQAMIVKGVLSEHSRPLCYNLEAEARDLFANHALDRITFTRDGVVEEAPKTGLYKQLLDVGEMLEQASHEHRPTHTLRVIQMVYHDCKALLDLLVDETGETNDNPE